MGHGGMINGAIEDHYYDIVYRYLGDKSREIKNLRLRKIYESFSRDENL